MTEKRQIIVTRMYIGDARSKGKIKQFQIVLAKINFYFENPAKLMPSTDPVNKINDDQNEIITKGFCWKSATTFSDKRYLSVSFFPNQNSKLFIRIILNLYG
jgi:hypothetical protein